LCKLADGRDHGGSNFAKRDKIGVASIDQSRAERVACGCKPTRVRIELLDEVPIEAFTP
jgi:hypothetical protein